MPVGLIVFGDKSHTNLHETLALTPIMFTLTLFNWTECNNTRFWRLIGYIPNLSYGKGVAECRKTSDKLQEEDTCISLIFKSLHKITRAGGFNLAVLGQNVHVKVWIHYFIGVTEGNNKWLGQYSGNRDRVQQPYQDCKCTFDNLKHTNPTCIYLTLEEIKETKRRKHNNVDGGIQYFKLVSMYDIKNALLK
jgi:hypothetical protein